MPAALIDPKFLKKLELLNIVSKKVKSGIYKGEHTSRVKGSSVEFSDFREYYAGDDFRYIDWNAYARMGKFFLKMFMEEKDLNIAIIIDSSFSMDFGAPTKLEFAKKVAACIAYIGLSNQDRVSLLSFSGGSAAAKYNLRGKDKVFEAFDFLSNIKASGHTAMKKPMRSAAAVLKHGGLAVYLSDFFDQEGYEGPLKELSSAGYETHCIQVLAEEECNPFLEGDLKLIDSETKESRDITESGELARVYRKALDSFTLELKKFCHARRFNYLFAKSGDDIEAIIFKYFAARGILR
jgi:uncharacterized protein (DUF58 family)